VEIDKPKCVQPKMRGRKLSGVNWHRVKPNRSNT